MNRQSRMPGGKKRAGVVGSMWQNGSEQSSQSACRPPPEELLRAPARWQEHLAADNQDSSEKCSAQHTCLNSPLYLKSGNANSSNKCWGQKQLASTSTAFSDFYWDSTALQNFREDIILYKILGKMYKIAVQVPIRTYYGKFGRVSRYAPLLWNNIYKSFLLWFFQVTVHPACK